MQTLFLLFFYIWLSMKLEKDQWVPRKCLAISRFSMLKWNVGCLPELILTFDNWNYCSCKN